MYKQAPPTAPRCQHIHSDNTRCGSPALHGQPFCYWHSSARAVSKKKNITIPVLDTPASVQLALTQVISRLLAGELDPKVAAIAINGLRIAAVNEKHLKIQWSLAESELTPAMAAELLECTPPFEAKNEVEERTEAEEENIVESDVILTAIEVSRKDLCIPAGTTTQAECGTVSPDCDRPVGTPANAPLTLALSEKKVKALRRIIRQGPRHPLFHSAARQLDKHTAAVANARILAPCGD